MRGSAGCADEERRKLTEKEAALLVNELHAAVTKDRNTERIEARIVRELMQHKEDFMNVEAIEVPRFSAALTCMWQALVL
jgi:hypothetical protein